MLKNKLIAINNINKKMDSLFFLLILLCVVPFQFLLFFTAYWCKKKIETIAKIGAVVIKKHIENPTLATQISDYNETIEESIDFKQENNENNEHQKFYQLMKNKHRQFLIEGSIQAISDTLRSKNLVRIHSNMSKQILDTVDNSPIASILLDLVSIAWVYQKNQNLL